MERKTNSLLHKTNMKALFFMNFFDGLFFSMSGSAPNNRASVHNEPLYYGIQFNYRGPPASAGQRRTGIPGGRSVCVSDLSRRGLRIRDDQRCSAAPQLHLHLWRPDCPLSEERADGSFRRSPADSHPQPRAVPSDHAGYHGVDAFAGGRPAPRAVLMFGGPAPSAP